MINNSNMLSHEQLDIQREVRQLRKKLADEHNIVTKISDPLLE